MKKLFFFICLMFLGASFAASADRTFYQIRMSGNPVGYTHYQIERDEEDLTMQTTVLFNVGQGELDQEIKLLASTRLNTQTLSPIEYHLSMYINGFTQSTIDTQFENNVAKQQIIAGGQSFDNEISLPTRTYLVDNNFRVDHYNIVLGQYDFEKGSTQLFHILAPLAVPQLPKAIGLQLAWAGGEKLTIGGTVYQSDLLEGDNNGTAMEFWYDRQSKRIVKWAVPSQETEVLLADDSVIAQKDATEDRLVALRENVDLPRITVDQDLGNAADLVSLQARLDLHVVAPAKPPSEFPNQWFDGEMTREGEVVHINGVVTNRVLEHSKEEFAINQLNPNVPSIYAAPEIESRHPQIQAKAREITAITQKTAYEVTKAIIDWVAREIDYDVRTVSAHTCLTIGAGDALSKSRLAVALLQSLNVPADILGGLLYVNNGAFVQHHWAEVFIEPKTGSIAVDALTGEVEEINAGHLALWRGGGRYAPELGKTEIEILDFHSAAIAWQDLIPLQVGEQNRYSFTLDGKSIGDNTSHIKGILTYRGIKCYEIEGTLKINHDDLGQIDAQSKMYLTLDGRPLFYQLEMEGNGEKQLHEYTLEGTRLRYTKGGETSEMWIDKETYFIGDRMFWQWDLLFRKQELFTGMQWETNALNPQNGTLRSLQIAVEEAEDIVVKGRNFSCFRLNVDGQLFWVSSVGRLIRYEHPEQKLVVELDVEPVTHE